MKLSLSPSSTLRFTLVSLLALILSPLAKADNSNHMIILNHYDKPINWIITINPQVLPGLSEKFTLAPNESIETEVLDMQKEAYLSGKDESDHSAFWGIEVVNNQLRFHGYIGKGIAYSWKNNIITFCTPEEYKKQHQC